MTNGRSFAFEVAVMRTAPANPTASQLQNLLQVDAVLRIEPFFALRDQPMDTSVRRWQELTVRKVACLVMGLALILVVAGCASDSRPTVVAQPFVLPALNEYCAAAQKEIAASRVPARNVLMTDWQAFSR